MRRASSEPPLTTPRLPTPAHPLRPSPSCSAQRFRKAKEKTVQETAICDAICVAKEEVVRLRGPLTSAVEALQEADGAAPELSAFEMQRLENMKQNQAVLQRLGLGGSGLAAAAAGESAPPRCVYASTVWCICERTLCIRDRVMCIHIYLLERVRILRIHTIDIMVSSPTCSVYTQSIFCVYTECFVYTRDAFSVYTKS